MNTCINSNGHPHGFYYGNIHKHKSHIVDYNQENFSALKKEI